VVFGKTTPRIREGRLKTNIAIKPARMPRMLPQIGNRRGIQPLGESIAHRPQTHGTEHQMARINASLCGFRPKNTSAERLAIAIAIHATSDPDANRINIKTSTLGTH
jgi:hypothetical protein